MTRVISILCILSGVAMSATSEDAEDSCQKRWKGHGTYSGTGPYCLIEYDDGAGSSLFAGGAFVIDGVPTPFAVLRGGQWRGFETPLLPNTQDHACVRKFVVHDDGSGPSLYLLGDFLVEDHPETRNAVKWDGITWTPLGTGLPDGRVLSATWYDLGEGSEMFVGGIFDAQGPITTNNIAKWNGTRWSGVGNWGGTWPFDLAGLENEKGRRLYAVCFVGYPTPFKQWDGHKWSEVEPISSGYGLFGLQRHNDGSGDALFVGGERFTVLTDRGESLSQLVGKFDGQSWFGIADSLPPGGCS